MKNLLTSIPAAGRGEIIEQILNTGSVRIERIISMGHTSPASGWYDQDEDEWVLVLQGAGKITFENGSEFLLCPGDSLDIYAHQKHRVSWTDPAAATIWLAIFYHR